MVGETNRPHHTNSNRVGENNSQGSPIGVRLRRDHNIERETILKLIKDALEPLQTDPVPERIVINNIQIFREESGDIAITCEVSYR